VNVPEAPRGAGVDAATAWQRSLAHNDAVWDAPPRNTESVKARLHRGIVAPRTEPKFAIGVDDAFFCIGSCFARELEDSLLVHGLRVDSLNLPVALDTPAQRRTGMVNKFTTPSMLNELLWAFGEQPFPENALIESPEGYYDLQLRPNVKPRPLDDVRGRRSTVIGYFERIRRANVVVLTLGLTEIWFDRRAGLYLNGIPPQRLVERYPERFTLHARTYAETLADLEACRRLLVAHVQPGVRLVVTVSPIPLRRTFFDEDVLTANGYSKAVLRAAAGDFAAAHDDVAYFGSYEMITVSDRALVFRKDDEIHVYPEAANAVTAAFLRAYGLPLTAAHPEFHEQTYLRLNPDVSEAVARGEFASGYDHWLRHGRDEERPLRDDTPGSPGLRPYGDVAR
jgi:hypothetical protein